MIRPHFDYVLDTSAILAVVLREPEASKVTTLLRSARDQGTTIGTPFLALMEIEYKLLRQLGKGAVELSLQTVSNWPTTVVESDEGWRRRAAHIKSDGKLSLADAWIAALALMLNAELVHKDREFDAVPGLRSIRL